jgi:pimeloyl-ACP methyl ester carboxylesterase
VSAVVLWIVLIAVVALVAPWPASYAVEALRRAPAAPSRLRWAPDIPILHADVDGCRIRYVRAGQGPNLLLLHTLRTQLDLFEKVVPQLARHFTVYAPDYPGHGYSDIPDSPYDADYFVHSVERFLDVLELDDVTVGGVSIGASIGLILASRRNPRVTRVVAINPYDYDRGRGLARSSPAGRMTVATAGIPIIGGTFTRLRSYPIVKTVFDGGVVDPANIPPPLLREMYRVGNRRGQYRAFLNLLRHGSSWEAATDAYGRIAIPVRLVWGEGDWARPPEREHDRTLIPGVEMVVVAGGGHFLPLDRPQAVIAQLTEPLMGRRPVGDPA